MQTWPTFVVNVWPSIFHPYPTPEDLKLGQPPRRDECGNGVRWMARQWQKPTMTGDGWHPWNCGFWGCLGFTHVYHITPWHLAGVCPHRWQTTSSRGFCQLDGASDTRHAETAVRTGATLKAGYDGRSESPTMWALTDPFLLRKDNYSMGRSFDECRWLHIWRFPEIGVPKSSILVGFSTINQPFWGTPIPGNPHILMDDLSVNGQVSWHWRVSRLLCPRPWQRPLKPKYWRRAPAFFPIQWFPHRVTSSKLYTVVAGPIKQYGSSSTRNYVVSWFDSAYKKG